MKDQFATYEVSKQLNELGFDDECIAYYESDQLKLYESYHLENGFNTSKDSVFYKLICSPLWHQVKSWLWEKHKICFQLMEMYSERNRQFYFNIFREVTEYEGKPYEQKIFGLIQWEVQYRNSPITAEIEAIKKAVEYLYKQK